MPIDTGSLQLLLKKLYEPIDLVVDKSTVGRLEELCSTMTDTCGLIEATLQLAVEDKGEKRTTYIKTALSLSARGTRAIKMFLSEWNVLFEDSKSRDSCGRSAKDSSGEPDLAATLYSLVARGLLTITKHQPLAELERSAVMNALREAGGDKGAASRILGIGKTTLYRKLKEYNLPSQLEIPRGEISR